MTAFFALYLTEGIPLGFTATAVATQMRRQGLGPGEIGAFVGSLYLPWAFKWAAGPFADVVCARGDRRFRRPPLPAVGLQVGGGTVRRRVLVRPLGTPPGVDRADAGR